jgi:hypothetical protein
MSQSYPYGVGLSNVGSYQVSGIPFVSGGIVVVKDAAPIQITFPEVTKRIIVNCRNGSNDVRVGFSSTGVSNGNYFALTSGTTVASRLTMDVKVSSIFLFCNTGSASSVVDIAAELTNISTSHLQNSGPTGLPNWSGSVGVG